MLHHPFRALKRILPRRLFGRSLIIVIAPILILQAVATLVFFDRHYRIVTAGLTRTVADEIGYLVLLEARLPAGIQRDVERQTAADVFGLPAEFNPGERLRQVTTEAQNALDRQLLYVFSTLTPQRASFDSQSFETHVEVRVQLSDGVLEVLVPRIRVAAANADIFVMWMIGSSLVLIGVAILFLRSQVRPIENLAIAAEAFGTGRSMPEFKPHGATEVRRAASAFLKMRGRIERHVQQRTDMLAGVSHDLRTPLARMRLQLAMMPRDADHDAMSGDVLEMQHMVDEYLDFARGEGGEEAEATDVSELVREAARDSVRTRKMPKDAITLSVEEGAPVVLRRNALKRCLTNVIDNALKYGSKISIALKRLSGAIEIEIEDNGPGIPQEHFEDAFRPFHRLNEDRNLQFGGVGLGLAIARDIARAHGGDMRLEKSALGGLRAVIRIPV